MSATEDEHLEKWRGWLERIYDDIILLHANLQIWGEIDEMLEAKPEIPERDFIRGWIKDQAVAALAMGIRRQADTRPDVVSLARLLDDIEAHHEVITRERYVEQICQPGDDEYLRSALSSGFDKWAGDGKAVLDPAAIQERRRKLTSTVEKIVRHVNKKLAHSDESDPATGFTYEELDAAMGAIGDLLKDMSLLLTCVSLTSADPTITVAWRRAFMVPWAPEDEVERWKQISAFIAERDARSRREESE